MPQTFIIPNSLRYWINSIPYEPCVLFSSSSDLQSGDIFACIIASILGSELSIDRNSLPSKIIEQSLQQLANIIGWDNMPNYIKDDLQSVSRQIVEGHSEMSILVLEYLQVIHKLSTGSSPDPDRSDAVDQSNSRANRKASIKSEEPNISRFETRPKVSQHEPQSRPAVSEGPPSRGRSRPREAFERGRERERFPELSSASRMDQYIERSEPRQAVPEHRTSISPHPRPAPMNPSSTVSALDDRKHVSSKGRKFINLADANVAGSHHQAIIEVPCEVVLNLSKKTELAFWARDHLKISSAHRLSAILTSRGLDCAATVIIAPCSSQRQESSKEGRFVIDYSISPIDLELLDYIEAISAYDPNIDPNSRGLVASCEGRDCSPLGVALDNDWRNGVFLSEFIASAVVKGQQKELVKEVDVIDLGGLRNSIKSTSSSRSLDAAKRLVLAGTVIIVKSKAQALRNINLCLKTIKTAQMHIDLPASLSAERLLLGSSEYMWSIIHSVYHSSELSRMTQARVQSTLKRRARSAPPRIASSAKQSMQRAPLLDASVSATRRVVVSSRRKSIASPRRAQSADPAVAVRRSIDEGQQTHRRQEDAPVAELRQHQAHPAVAANSSRAATRFVEPSSLKTKATAMMLDRDSSVDKEQLRSLDVYKAERMKSRLLARKYRAKILAQQDVFSALPRPDSKKPWQSSTSLGPHSDDDADGIHEDSDVSRRVKPQRRSPGLRENSRRLAKRDLSQGFWLPPSTDPMFARGVLSSTPLPSVTMPQQNSVREWLFSLGLVVKDGEGGFFFHGYSPHTAVVARSSSAAFTNIRPGHVDGSGLTTVSRQNSNHSAYYGQFNMGAADYSIPTHPVTHSTVASNPLPLSQDRLRNGETLCDLLILLEPIAASHANLAYHVNRQPRSLQQATDNVERALWLFRIRRSPPIPASLLCQTDAILKASKDVLWGLLWEIMQAYPLSVETPGETRVGLNIGVPVGASRLESSIWPPKADSSNPNQMPVLDYSRAQRRLLDTTLIRWLSSMGVLSIFTGGLSSPATVLALEGPIRDGTLLCIVLEFGFKRFVRGLNKQPHTFTQCLSNVSKCLLEFKTLASMNQRYLRVSGVAESVVRGDWNVILGLLEDVYRCHCSARFITPHFASDVAVDLSGVGLSFPSKVAQQDGRGLEFAPHLDSAWYTDRHAASSESFERSHRDHAFQPKLSLVDSSIAPSAFLEVKPVETTYDTMQSYLIDQKQKTSSTSTSSTLHKSAPSVSFSDTLSATGAAAVKKSDIDIFPGTYSTTIANVFNEQYDSLSRPTGSSVSSKTHSHRYSALDLTSGDAALDAIGLGGSAGGGKSSGGGGEMRDISPSTRILRDIDGVLADRHSWKTTTRSNFEDTSSATTKSEIVPDVYGQSGGISGPGSVLQLKPSEFREKQSKDRMLARQQDLADLSRNDFGSGSGESIVPGRGASSGSTAGPTEPNLQTYTRQRDDEEEQRNSSQGNILRTNFSPPRGPRPATLRLQTTIEKGVYAPAIDAEQRISDVMESRTTAHQQSRGGSTHSAANRSVSPRKSRRHPSKESSSDFHKTEAPPVRNIPTWVADSADQVVAGVGAQGVPTWVLEGLPAGSSNNTGAQRQQQQQMTPSKTVAHRDPVSSSKIVGGHYDEMHSLATSSPQSIADDSLLMDEKDGPDRNRSSRAVGKHNARPPATATLKLNPRSLSGNRAYSRGNPQDSPVVGAALASVGDLMSEKRARDAERLGAWLESLGIRFDDKKAFVNAYTVDSKLSEFSNGVLLGKLLFKLERLKELKGFVANPKTPAQGLQNIKRVFEVLATNNKIPVSLISCAEEVFEGKGAPVLELLSVLKKVYSHITV